MLRNFRQLEDGRSRIARIEQQQVGHRQPLGAAHVARPIRDDAVRDVEQPLEQRRIVHRRGVDATSAYGRRDIQQPLDVPPETHEPPAVVAGHVRHLETADGDERHDYTRPPKLRPRSSLRTGTLSATERGRCAAAALRERATRAGPRPRRRHNAPVLARGQARRAVASVAAPARSDARPARTG